MDIRSMACFVAIAEELHFRRAAERMHLTQPSLSQRIRSLENEIGTTLFARDRRSVALTPAGAAFLEPARKAVDAADVAQARALAAARGEAGRLRLGFTVIAFYGALPEAVRMFRSQHPQVEIELSEMNSPLLERALTAGTIDLGVLHPPLLATDLVTRALPDEPLMLALPESHPLARKSRVAVADLAQAPILIAPRAIGPSFYDRIIAYFASAGVSPRIAQQVTPMTTLTGLVAAGVGMGFVTAGIARLARPGVVYRPLMPEPPSLPLAAAWQALTPSGRRFLDIVLGLTRGATKARRKR